MNNKTKLVINILIIFSFLFGIYFTQGYYFSLNNCINDYSKAIYIENNNILCTYRANQSVGVVCADENNEHLSIIELFYSGIVYKGVSHMVVLDSFQDNNNANCTFKYIEDIGFISAIYRKNKDIAYVEYTFKGNDKVISNQWNDDYTYICYSGFEYPESTFTSEFPIFRCEAYDANGNLIEVIH